LACSSWISSCLWSCPRSAPRVSRWSKKDEQKKGMKMYIQQGDEEHVYIRKKMMMKKRYHIHTTIMECGE